MLISALLLVAGVDAATTTFLRTDELLALCARDRDRCRSYVEGSSDMLKFLQDTGVVPARHCTGPDMTLGRLTDDVVAELRRSPELRGQGAGGAVWVALTRVAPCTTSDS